MALIAKQICKNKFWIVESDGEKVATIQSTPEGVVYVHDDTRERFGTLKNLAKKYSISFNGEPATQPANRFNVYGFPCDCTPFNEMMHLTKKAPIYTKVKKSMCYYCAGHYAINIKFGWMEVFCPKLLVLNRHTFAGPFQTREEVQQYIKGTKR